jgi:hypothetical protein
VKVTVPLSSGSRPAGELAKAWTAYEGFCRWREQHSVRSIAHEVSLVSETHQLGGTPDCIAFVDGELGLLDFKTCTKVPAKPYEEQLMAMAAHATLWNEHHSEQLIRACHVVYLPKDGSAHKHHSHANYGAQWEEFSHLLRAFQTKHDLPKGVERERPSLELVNPEPVLRRKPRIRVPAATADMAQRILPLVSFVR